MNTYFEGPACGKKLTISIDEQVYEGLHSLVGRRHISSFIESLVGPHVIGADLEAAYHRMAEASEWAKATVGDVRDEPR